MSAPKLFEIFVRNPRTGETIAFAGQGAGVVEALADGGKTLQTPYRQSSDGRVMPGVGLGMLPKVAAWRKPALAELELPAEVTELQLMLFGPRVLRTLAEFESDVPYSAALEEKR